MFIVLSGLFNLSFFNRLQRILRRGKFAEAERFARTFKLDMQLVYKAQIQRYMQEFQPWNHSGGSVKESFQRFIELLNNISVCISMYVVLTYFCQVVRFISAVRMLSAFVIHRV